MKTGPTTFFFYCQSRFWTMKIHCLFLLATSLDVVLSSDTRGRGMDEWSMMGGQPEVLIVKEKGGNGGSHAPSKSMDMKDLTPILCLLAPLLLAAIMIPAKMTMMMNGMMAMNPMINPQMNGNYPMYPMLPMMSPLSPYSMMSSLLTSGSGGSQQLPIGFKTGILSKEFAEKNFSNGTDNGRKNFSSDGVDSGEDGQSTVCRKNKKGCKKSFYDKYLSSKESSYLKHNDAKFEKKNGSSRVWNARSNQIISVADQILNLLNEVENMFQS